jgi:hypothetical protein
MEWAILIYQGRNIITPSLLDNLGWVNHVYPQKGGGACITPAALYNIFDKHMKHLPLSRL